MDNSQHITVINVRPANYNDQEIEETEYSSSSNSSSRSETSELLEVVPVPEVVREDINNNIDIGGLEDPFKYSLICVFTALKYAIPIIMLMTDIIILTKYHGKECDTPFREWVLVMMGITGIFFINDYYRAMNANEEDTLHKKISRYSTWIVYGLIGVHIIVGVVFLEKSNNCEYNMPYVYSLILTYTLIPLAFLGIPVVLILILFIAEKYKCNRLEDPVIDEEMLIIRRRAVIREAIIEYVIPIEPTYDIYKYCEKEESKAVKISGTSRSDNEIKICDNSNTCVICCADYIKDDMLTVFTCNHSYHQKCINEWLVRNPVCPLCKRRIF